MMPSISDLSFSPIDNVALVSNPSFDVTGSAQSLWIRTDAEVGVVNATSAMMQPTAQDEAEWPRKSLRYLHRRIQQGIRHKSSATRVTWPRAGAALMAWVFSASAGAVTIKTEVNANPAMCGQLLQMIKSAGIPQMTDAQLCDFRLASLPPSKIAGFTFSQWKPLAVANPPTMFVKMIKGNRATNSVARQPDLTALRNSAIQAVQDHNLTFHTTTLPIGERNITFVSMDIRRC